MADAETVAVKILADTSEFTRQTKVAASGFGGDMKRIEASAKSSEVAVARSMQVTTRSMAQAAQQSRNLGYQISDIGTQLAGGQSPFLILAQQGPQVANALDGARGSVGKFASFISGPWGAALLAGTTILGGLAAKMLATGDSVDDLVDKLRGQARETDRNRQAQEEFENTLEGVRLALDANEEALEKLGEAHISASERALQEADAQKALALEIRKATVARLESAQAAYEAARAQNFGAGGGAGAGMAQAVYADRVSQLERILREAQAEVARASDQSYRARSFIAVERGMADEVGRINNQFEERIEVYRREAVARGENLAVIEKEVRALRDKRDALIEEHRAAEKAARGSGRSRRGSSLPAVTSGEVASLLRDAIGGTVTSTKRTAAQNRAAGGDKNSYHLSDQAIDFVPSAGMQSLAKEQIQAIAEQAGIKVLELLGPGDKGHDDHFHLAFDKKRLGPDQVAAAREKAEEERLRAVEAEAERIRQVSAEAANLDDIILRKQTELAASSSERLALENRAIEAAAAEYEAQVEHAVKTGEVTAAEAKILKAKNAQIAEIEKQIVAEREAARQRRENLDIATGLIDNSLDVLQSEQDLAVTQKERRRIALAILEAEHEKLRLVLEAQLIEAEKNGASEQELAVIRQRLANLQTMQANATAGAMRDTASPFEDYINGLRDTASAMNEEMEAVAVNGLASIVDGLGSVAAGFTSLGDLARNVLADITAQLIRLAAQQLIIKALGETIGQSVTDTAEGAQSASQAASSGATAATGATTAQAATVAAAWAPAAAAASLATLGANQGPAIAALIATHAVSAALSAAGGALALKDGGPIYGPGGPRSDMVPVAASNGEFMIKASSASKLGRGALDFINRTGELPAFADGGPISAVRPSNGRLSSGRGDVSMDADFKRELRSIVDQAARMMPDVQLYPTLDPASAMERMLSNPLAQRKFFDFVGENSGKFNSQLNR